MESMKEEERGTPCIEFDDENKFACVESEEDEHEKLKELQKSLQEYQERRDNTFSQSQYISIKDQNVVKAYNEAADLLNCDNLPEVDVMRKSV